MIANNAVTRAATPNGANLRRGRASVIALWLTQIALAAMFLTAGGSKLAGGPAMVSLFDAIGLGQWFRYVTGVIEVTSAIALLLPSAAAFGAMLLIPTSSVHSQQTCSSLASPVAPLVLLIGAVAVAWVRWNQRRRD